MSTAAQPSLFDDGPMASEGKAGGLRAPFQFFGGKSGIASLIWYAFGEVKHYIEPFCGSAAVLLANPRPASLEVIGDSNGYIANFWRAVKYQPDLTWAEADYPVSHIDMAARHIWLSEPARVAALNGALMDPEWTGDARMAGWWVYGQCCWIGSGWCDGKVPHTSNAGMGLQAPGQVPHTGNAGMGLQAPGKVPHTSDAGMGAQSPPDGELLTPYQGRAREWIRALSERLARVRVIHGDWTRCLNMHYGDKGKSAAIFFDPPYVSFERLYRDTKPVALDVAAWCAEHPEVRVALSGHVGDYDLPGWQVVNWTRGRLSYSGGKTTDKEALYFSPACRRVK